MKIAQQEFSEKADGPAMEILIAGIASRAGAADRGEADLSADIADLHRCGLLFPLPEGDRLVEVLRALGRANLSVGRLYEGHVNALILLEVYGSQTQKAACRNAALDGVIFGVWGADGDTPVTFERGADGGLLIHGSKRFCSGLGIVGKAIVTARGGDGGLQLLLLDVGDPARADASAWRTSGMRATMSGAYDFEEIERDNGEFVEDIGEIEKDKEVLLGAPGDFMREPHFEGGVWRYAAVHVGGMEALADAARAHIEARGLTGDPMMRRRLADLAIHCETGRLWVERSAALISRPGAGEAEVAHVLLARETVERACQDVIAIVDRIIGTASFFEGHPVERIRRDLSFFLRQANLDGKLDRAADSLTGDRSFGDLW